MYKRQAESRLTDLFVYTPTLHDAVVQWTAELTPAAVAVRIRLETADGTLLAEQTAQAAETGKMQLSVPDAQPWDTEHPVLHHATAELLNAAGRKPNVTCLRSMGCPAAFKSSAMA